MQPKYTCTVECSTTRTVECAGLTKSCTMGCAIYSKEVNNKEKDNKEV
jgi:hypothetical protein